MSRATPKAPKRTRRKPAPVLPHVDLSKPFVLPPLTEYDENGLPIGPTGPTEREPRSTSTRSGESAAADRTPHLHGPPSKGSLVRSGLVPRSATSLGGLDRHFVLTCRRGSGA